MFLTVFIGCSSQLQHGEDMLTCPSKTPDLSSVTLKHGKVAINFINSLSDDVILNWVSFSGEEKINSIIGASSSQKESSYSGHVYRVRTFEQQLLREYVIDIEDVDVTVNIKRCKGISLFKENRDEEFSNLTISNPFNCEPKEDSSKWSCIRKVSEQEEVSRIKDNYGFHENEVRGVRSIHQVQDDTYVSQIPFIPGLTETGYKLMEQTDKMKKCLFPWWEKESERAIPHGPVAGDYTNHHTVPLTKLDLDEFQHVRVCIVSEMKEIMQWWTGHNLKHTSTFGMRFYHRDSMLINHVDRADTHLASAVIQVMQEADPNGGWPLELRNENGLHEVYLQPGQLVLYEGARLFHGRPMRFKGEKFGNIFNHFAPVDWHGPHSNVPDWARIDIEIRQKNKKKKQSMNNNDAHHEL